MDTNKCPHCGSESFVGLSVCDPHVYRIRTHHWPDVERVCICRKCYAVLSNTDLRKLVDAKGNTLFSVPDKGFCLIDPQGNVVEHIQLA